jgi:hypothetical protein
VLRRGPERWRAAARGRVRARPFHHNLALPALQLLGPVVAPLGRRSGGLDRFGRRCRTPDPFAIGHDEVVVQALEQARVAPQGKPAEHRALGRQIARQKPPRDPAAQDVEDGVHHLAQAGSGPTAPGRHRKERLDQSPFCVGQIRFLSQPVAAMLPPGGQGPPCTNIKPDHQTRADKFAGNVS